MRRHGLAVWLAVALLPAVGFAAEEESLDYSKITLDVGNFNPASRCGGCHIDIYALWSQSMHSRALTDPAFLATFEDPRIQGNRAAKKHCLQCHAPTLHYNPALSLDSAIVQEGVTCDFCHSIQGLAAEAADKPFQVLWGKLKRGPYDDTNSPVHDTRQSPLFNSGELCGGCHEMANLKGLPVITTHSEWKEKYFGKIGDASCQECHMPLAAGVTVSEKYRKTKRRINLHSFPGGHSRVQLLDALELAVLEESKMFGKMKVKLGLTNTGAGHYIPTGNPLRKVLIDFNAFDASNNLIFNKQVLLAKDFIDASGNALTTDIGILMDATSISSDNRIAPGETRELTFEFLAPNEKLLVEANVIYMYENAAFPELARKEKLITFTKIVNKDRAANRSVKGENVKDK